MTQRQISAGSLEETILYDDTDVYTDGETQEAVRTDGQIRVDSTAPTQDYHLTRKDYVDASAGSLLEEDINGDLMPKA